MKAIFWLLLFVVALLTATLVLRFAVERGRQARPIPYEVSADSIATYQERLAQLKDHLNRLQDKARQSEPWERLRLERRLQLLSAKIRDLEVAVAQWRAARSPNAAGNLYRNCILLYGQASGVCDALAADTLPVPEEKR